MNNQAPGWWGERFLSYLSTIHVGPATDGQWKSAWRADGQVQIRKGRIAARVWMSEWRQAEATVRIRPWTEQQWRRALDAVAASPDLARRVLSGAMGAELEEALGAAGLPFFPPLPFSAARCTCTQRSGSCRHLNFLAVHVAAMLDANPFLWLEVLGRPRAELLAELKGRLADLEAGKATPEAGKAIAAGEVAVTASEEAAPLDPARFWEAPADPEAIPVRIGAGAAPDALIRSLGPLPLEEDLYLLPDREPVPVEEVVRRMVVRVARTATGLALGELEPNYGSDPVPGKPVSLAARLAQEVEEAVRSEDALLAIDELAGRCPTAAAAGGEEGAAGALREACALLPPDLVVVAGRYVGPAAALIRDAVFHHVVTLDEWVEGEAGDDADWVRALAAANRPRPSLAPWFQRLRPEVGDELILRFPEGRVEVSLRRRTERNLTERLRSDAIASRLLQVLTGTTRWGRLSEQEAVACLLAEGGYRGDLHPDPLWLVPLLGPGLYWDPAERAVSRHPNTWRPGQPRFVYGVWRRDQAIMGFQARLMKRGASRREVETATACIALWGRIWPGAQDEPGAAGSLGPFLHFLWNVAPLEAARKRIPPETVPGIMAEWFAYLEEAYPAVAGVYTRHRLACSLLDHYAERCRTAPPQEAGEEAVLVWQAEGFRWMGPIRYLGTGSYR